MWRVMLALVLLAPVVRAVEVTAYESPESARLRELTHSTDELNDRILAVQRRLRALGSPPAAANLEVRFTTDLGPLWRLTRLHVFLDGAPLVWNEAAQGLEANRTVVFAAPVDAGAHEVVAKAHLQADGRGVLPYLDAIGVDLSAVHVLDLRGPTALDLRLRLHDDLTLQFADRPTLEFATTPVDGAPGEI